MERTFIFNPQVILTADVPVLENRGGIIFTSRDAGATFKFIQLPFHLVQPITYHFLNPDYLAALSIDVSYTHSCFPALKMLLFSFTPRLGIVFWTVVALCIHTHSTHLKGKVNIALLPPDLQGGLWLSLDFGAKWTKVHDGVHSFSWWG